MMSRRRVFVLCLFLYTPNSLLTILDENSNEMPKLLLDIYSIILVLEFCGMEDMYTFSCTSRHWKILLSETSLSFLWRRLFYFYIFKSSTTNLQYRCSKSEHNNNTFRTLVNWREKLKDIYLFLNSGDKVSMEQSDIGKISRRAQSSAAQISITSSKTTGGSMSTENDRVIICFGGATDNYWFLDSCDVVSLTHKRIFQRVRPYPLPSKRWLHTTTSIGNKVLVLGGSGALHDYDFNQQSFVLTVEADNSGEGYQIHRSPLLYEGDLAELPQRRAGHTVTVYSIDTSATKFILFGGKTSNHVFDEMETTGHVLDHHLYWNDVYSAVVYAEDTTVRITWQLVQCSGSYPRPRHCHSAVYVEKNSIILIFGGWAGQHEFLNDVHLLDVNAFAWTRVNTEGVPPCPRCQTNALLVPPVRSTTSGFATSMGYLLVYGGACHYDALDEDVYGSTVRDLDDYHVLDLDTFVWLPLPPAQSCYPPGRGGVQSVIPLENNEGWLMLGGMHSDHGSNMPVFRDDVILVKPKLGAMRSAGNIDS